MDDWIDDRSQWVVWKGKLTEEEVRKKYFEMTKREPDRIHSPEESATDWWWTGWVSKEEYYKYDKGKRN